MKTKLLITSFLIIVAVLQIQAQIDFEPGYFISLDGQKTECLIKNVDWKFNPEHFDYKLGENSEVQEGDFLSVSEFGINNESKFVRAVVERDQSSDILNKLDFERNPQMVVDTLFLKVLLEGKAKLFYYEGSGATRFFFEMGGSGIKQLVYKKYRVENEIRENKTYLQQLSVAMNNGKVSKQKILAAKYNVKDLVGLFSTYNGDENKINISFVKKRLFKESVNFKINTSLNINSLEAGMVTVGEKERIGPLIKTEKVIKTFDFEVLSSLGFGIETEYILPFNKNKMSILISPTYLTYESSYKVSNGVINANCKSLEFPFGIRYYFYLNEELKVYLNGLFTYAAFNFNSKLDRFRILDGSFVKVPDWPLITSAAGYFVYGVGIQYKKVSLDFSYSNNDIIGGDSGYHSNLKRLSFSIGYQIF